MPAFSIVSMPKDHPISCLFHLSAHVDPFLHIQSKSLTRLAQRYIIRASGLLFRVGTIYVPLILCQDCLPIWMGRPGLLSGSQYNLRVPISQLQHDWVIDLNGMFSPVDADDEINRSGFFRNCLGRRRRGFNRLCAFGCACQEIGRNDAPTSRRAVQTQTGSIDFC